MICGAFDPPQQGEIDWIRATVPTESDLVLRIIASDNDAITIERRLMWMRRIFTEADVQVLEGPEPAACTRIPKIPGMIEPRVLRADPFLHWERLPRAIRPDYLVRIAIVGPESVGKSTLAANLARHLGGQDVQEFARDAFPWGDPNFKSVPEHMVAICEGHAEWIRQAERVASRWLFSDTEAITTLAWSELYFGDVPSAVTQAADLQEFDLFLLLDTDVPWVPDGTRTWEKHRAWLFDRLKELLETRSLPYCVVSGDWGARFEQATLAIQELGPPLAPRGLPSRFPHR